MHPFSLEFLLPSFLPSASSLPSLFFVRSLCPYLLLSSSFLLSASSPPSLFFLPSLYIFSCSPFHPPFCLPSSPSFLSPLSVLSTLLSVQLCMIRRKARLFPCTKDAGWLIFARVCRVVGLSSRRLRGGRQASGGEWKIRADVSKCLRDREIVQVIDASLCIEKRY